MNKANKEVKNHPIKFLRQRKFLMVLPVLVLPFVFLLVWTLGLAGDVHANGADKTEDIGLNLNLPSASPGKDSAWNKMRYYEQADKDSAKLRALLKNDPYRQQERPMADDSLLPLPLISKERTAYMPSAGRLQPDQNEERVYQKLADLNEELEKAATKEREAKDRKPPTRDTIPLTGIDRKEVDRLERMMLAMNQPKEEDPEMTQLNQMLEKILDIQHPTRMEDKVQQQSIVNKRQVFSVGQPGKDMPTILEPSTLDNHLSSTSWLDSMPVSMKSIIMANRFYSIDDDNVDMTPAQNVFAAVIHEDQTLVSGSTVRLRLLGDLMIAGVRIPRGHFVFAETTLTGERLSLTINSIGYGQHILPVSLTVYDQKDCLRGIRIPGAITRDVAKRSAAQSVQQMGSMNLLNPSIGAQVASAGIEAAQNLVKKSSKLVRVTVTAGYPVFLKDEQVKE